LRRGLKVIDMVLVEITKVPKWTRVVDLRRMRGKRFAISMKNHFGRKITSGEKGVC
jgi:hypothetical protein